MPSVYTTCYGKNSFHHSLNIVLDLLWIFLTDGGKCLTCEQKRVKCDGVPQEVRDGGAAQPQLPQRARRGVRHGVGVMPGVGYDFYESYTCLDKFLATYKTNQKTKD